MHNVDRTLQEFETMGQELENGYSQEGFGQQESSQEFGNEFEFEYENGQEINGEMQQEQQEFEAALELLEITNEQELNQFLGGLISRAAGAVKSAASNFVKSQTGQALGRHLVSFGKQTLPRLATQYGGQAGGWLGQRAGQAIGGRIGGAAGSRIVGALGQRGGSWLGQQAGNYAGQQAGNYVSDQAKRIFNLELESMNPENQELEIARAYYRYANNLARRTYQTYRRNPRWSPRAISRQVIPATARLYAPGLLGNAYDNGMTNGQTDGERGTWIRQNGAIVLYGV